MFPQLNDEMTESHLCEIMPDFEVCARRALERILRAPTRCPRDFRSLPGAPANSFTCGIRSENGFFEAALYLGVDRMDFGLLPGNPVEAEILDAIGEIANVMAGSFLGLDSFKHRFGPMLPSPPLFSFQAGCLGKAACIQGVILINAAKVSAGFLVQSIQKDDPR